MSMLTAQCDELRDKALLFEGYNNGEISRMLRVAADTIETLREKAQAAILGNGECEYKPMWDEDDPLAEEYLGMWYTSCGDALIWNADNDGCWEPPKFCPYCGGAVKR